MLLSEPIDSKYWEILIHFFQSGIVLHHGLSSSEKMELAYVFDYFGIDINGESYKFNTLNELRHHLVYLAEQSEDDNTVDLVQYLIPNLHNEFQI